MALVEDDVLHGNLVSWINHNGGHVHPNLALHTPGAISDSSSNEKNDKGGCSCSDGHDDPTSPSRFSHRGIFAKHGPIAEGEILIRLPRQLALDGSQLPGSYAISDDDVMKKKCCATGNQSKTPQQRKNASPWLRCLASLINAWRQTKRSEQGNAEKSKNAKDDPEAEPGKLCYDPYLASLPPEYDSLLNWSAGEIRCFLAGTSLGAAALQDASDGASNGDQHDVALRERFLKTVVPYLGYLKSDGLLPGHIARTDDAVSDEKTPKRQKIDTATTTTTDNNDDVELRDLEGLYPLFRDGCMCISTRAFHMQSPGASQSSSTGNVNANANDIYHGPYLLPYIDLLNHSPRGSLKHVTTLRRDADGSFVMVAERDISVDEEVCHSYDSGAANANDNDKAEVSADTQKQAKSVESSSLNSAQLLQTFGFVDVDEAVKKLLGYYEKKGTVDGKGRILNPGNTTPAVLTKAEISLACKQLASSSYPEKLRKSMEESGMLDEGWEYWKMPVLEESSPRWESIALFSEELIVPFGASISDEMITISCLHFLPDDVVKELIEESTAEEGTHGNQPQSLLLGNEVLEDYFLGKLVLQALINALGNKANGYKVSSEKLLAGHKEHDQAQRLLTLLGGYYRSDSNSQNGASLFWGENGVADASALSKTISMREDQKCSLLLQNFKYGMVISLEERACLLELKKKCLEMLMRLDG